MIIVPILKDIIVTTDNVELIVNDYSNFKTAGPCVYATPSEGGKPMPVYFLDIASVNGVKVEFNNQSKVLEVLGHFKRKIHLPQKHDKIEINGEFIKVDNVKLHSKPLGLSRGLLIIGADDEAYSLQQISNIKRPIGDSYFDEKHFKKLYKEYLGFEHK